MSARFFPAVPRISARIHRALVGPSLALVVLAGLGAAQADTMQVDTLVGRLGVLWGDPHLATGHEEHDEVAGAIRLMLTDDTGHTTELAISPELSALHGGFVAWNGRRVEARVVRGPLEREMQADAGPDALRAASLTLLPEGPTERRARLDKATVSGSKPWVSILCKFSDIADEPQPVSFFQGMYANAPGALDHYWRAQSYDAIDIVGSVAVDWVDLPSPQATYAPTPGAGSNANLNQVFVDCTAAADPFVDFSLGGAGGFEGINIMLNGVLDCCAWGGGAWGSLDGVAKVWRTTWDPPWAYANVAVIAHEMGHGFGLPHANNFDDDGNPYDSPWDVMSSATGYSIDDPTYGLAGKHHTAYHKDKLGWISPNELLEVASGTIHTVTVDAMALPSTQNYRMIEIPIPGTDDWYTVETRDFLGYDGNIPGRAVIITHVDTARQEDAWAVDGDVPPANYGDNPGTMWIPGETFVDPTALITITVDFATADGFEVTVSSLAPLIFDDGFENGDIDAWSSSVP